jgi:hypothetical protein
LKVIAEDEHIGPVIMGRAKGTNRLKGDGEGVSDDVFISFLAIINKFIFALFGGKEESSPLWGEFLPSCRRRMISCL